MITILYIAMFWALFFTITYATHFIYIEKGWMPEPWTYFDYKPFNCHKCMTTWTLIASYTMAGIILSNVVFSVFGVILSILYGYGLYYQEVERTVYEEDYREPEQKPIGFTTMSEIQPQQECCEDEEYDFDEIIIGKDNVE